MKTNDMSTWTYWELLEEDRRWGKHAMQAEEVRFEIERRHRNWKTIGLGITAAGGVIAAIFTILNYVRH
jgi:hypothetical protein